LHGGKIRGYFIASSATSATCGPIIECMTWIIALAFLAIIASLVVALIIMMRPSAATPPTDEHGNPINGTDKPKGNMARALAFRVGFSVLLFIFVLISYWMGWIQPTGIANGQ